MLQGRKNKCGGDTDDRPRDEPQGVCLVRFKGLLTIGELFNCHCLKGQTFLPSGVPRNFVPGEGRGSTNSVEDRGQRKRGSGGGSL